MDKSPRRALAPFSRAVVAGGRVLNIFTGELERSDIVIEEGHIAAVVPAGEAPAPGRSGTHVAVEPDRAPSAGVVEDQPGETFVLDATDYVVVPGYVEPHAHLGLLAEPVQTLEQMAATGTTAVVADTYPFMVALSDEEFADVLDRFQALPVYLRWFLAPHARSFLENEEELFDLERLDKFLQRPDVIAVGEFTRWPLVDQGDPDLLRKIARARALGKRVEGHGAGASVRRLQRLVKHGITSDHEAITAEQVLDRLRVGLYTMLRHSSLRPDLPELVAAIRGELAHTNRVMLTADGPTPSWIHSHGYMNHLVRVAMEGGLEPLAAYRMATLNPAMYYGIDGDVGSIAPGRRADLLLLRDLSDPTPVRVMAAGRVVAEGGEPVRPFERVPWETYTGMRRPSGQAPDAGLFRMAAMDPGSGEVSAHSLVKAPGLAEPRDPVQRLAAAEDRVGAEGRVADALVTGDRGGVPGGVPTLHMAHTVILRVGDAAEQLPVQVALYDWGGRWLTRAFVTGFVDRLGGLASSYSPAYQLMVMGQRPDDMALAAHRVMERRGGMCLVENGHVVWELPLERGGLFTEMPWHELVQWLDRFEQLMRDRGYRHGELLYSMFFFGFDSLPDYRLTTRGIWDVRQHRVAWPPEVLGD